MPSYEDDTAIAHSIHQGTSEPVPCRSMPLAAPVWHRTSPCTFLVRTDTTDRYDAHVHQRLRENIPKGQIICEGEDDGAFTPPDLDFVVSHKPTPEQYALLSSYNHVITRSVSSSLTGSTNPFRYQIPYVAEERFVAGVKRSEYMHTIREDAVAQ
jgi:hypothetical protein